MKGYLVLLALAALLGLLCTIFPSKDKGVRESEVLESHGAIATYYGDRFHGECMANGEIFNKNAMVAASLTLPLGTKVRILRGGLSVDDVTITDRGPYVDNRHIDLSEGVARKLDMLEVGKSPVVIEVLEKPAKDIKYHQKLKQCLARQNKRTQSSNNPGAIRGFPMWYTHAHERHNYSKLFLSH